MILENFFFTTKSCIRANRREISLEVFRYIAGCVRDGQVGETGWNISVLAGARRFELQRYDIPMLRAFLARTESAAVSQWPQACNEAASQNQLHRGTERRKLKAPWVATVTLGGLESASHQLAAEAAGLATYVAFALLDGAGQ